MRSCELTQHIIVRFGSLRRYPVVHHRLPMFSTHNFYIIQSAYSFSVLLKFLFPNLDKWFTSRYQHADSSR